MDGIQRILQAVTMAISIMGAAIVIWGTAESIYVFFVMKITRSLLKDEDAIQESEAIRQRLGAHLLLGLEIFIAAGIINSVASPKWERIGILASIVGVRTVLSYFLRMEMKQGVRRNDSK